MMSLMTNVLCLLNFRSPKNRIHSHGNYCIHTHTYTETLTVSVAHQDPSILWAFTVTLTLTFTLTVTVRVECGASASVSRKNVAYTPCATNGNRLDMTAKGLSIASI